MAIDAFIKFEGQTLIKGDSADLRLKGSDGWSSLKGIRFGASNRNMLSGGAGDVGKAKFDDFEITRAVDVASPRLFGVLCTGAHFDAVTVVVRKAGPDGADPYIEYKFALVFVSNIDTRIGDGADVPVETVKFTYGAMQISYRPLDAQGKPGAAVVQPWSQLLDKPTLAVK